MSFHPYQVAIGAARDYRGYGKFGVNPSVTTTEESVWDQGGLYSYLESATQLTLSSSSADDTAAGTGARTVEIYGLDANRSPIRETLTLNGQTAVTTTQSYLRIFRMVVRTAGSGGENAGDLYAGTGTVTAGVPANVYAKVTVGRNQTLMCVWTAQGDKPAYLTGMFLSAQGTAGAIVAIRLVIRPLGEVFQTKYELLISESGGATYVPFPIPGYIPPGADIEIRAASVSGTNEVSASLGFMIGISQQ